MRYQYYYCYLGRWPTAFIPARKPAACRSRSCLRLASACSATTASAVSAPSLRGARPARPHYQSSPTQSSGPPRNCVSTSHGRIVRQPDAPHTRPESPDSRISPGSSALCRAQRTSRAVSTPVHGYNQSGRPGRIVVVLLHSATKVRLALLAALAGVVVVRLPTHASEATSAWQVTRLARSTTTCISK
eukprot:COSAG01_NODE_16112_length_1269_cov_1.488889_1_plen_188_part_00